MATSRITGEQMYLTYKNRNYHIKPESSFEDLVMKALPELKNLDKYKNMSDEDIIYNELLNIHKGNMVSSTNHYEYLNTINPVPDDPVWGQFSYEEILNMSDNGVVIPDEVLQWAKAQANEDVVNYQVDTDEVSTSADLSAIETDLSDNRTAASKKAVINASEKAQAQDDKILKKSKELSDKNSELTLKQNNFAADKADTLNRIESYSKELSDLEQKVHSGEKLSSNEQLKYKALAGVVRNEQKTLAVQSRDMQSELASLLQNMNSVEHISSVNENIVTQLSMKNQTFVEQETRSVSGTLPLINKTIDVSNNNFLHSALSGNVFSNMIDITQDIQGNSVDAVSVIRNSGALSADISLSTVMPSSVNIDTNTENILAKNNALEEQPVNEEKEETEQTKETEMNSVYVQEESKQEEKQPLKPETTEEPTKDLTITDSPANSEIPDLFANENATLPQDNLAMVKEESSDDKNNSNSNFSETELTATALGQDQMKPVGLQEHSLITDSSDDVNDVAAQSVQLENAIDNSETEKPAVDIERDTVDMQEKFDRLNEDTSKILSGLMNSSYNSQTLRDNRFAAMNSIINNVKNSINPIDTKFKNLKEQSLNEAAESEQQPVPETKNETSLVNNKPEDTQSNNNINSQNAEIADSKDNNTSSKEGDKEDLASKNVSDDTEDLQEKSSKIVKTDKSDNKEVKNNIKRETKPKEKPNAKPIKTEADESLDIQQDIRQITATDNVDIEFAMKDVDNSGINSENTQQAVAEQIQSSKPEYLKNPMFEDVSDSDAEVISMNIAKEVTQAEKQEFVKESSQKNVRESIRETMQSILSNVNQKLQSEDTDKDKKYKMFTRFEIEKQDAIRKTVQKISNAKDAR